MIKLKNLDYRLKNELQGDSRFLAAVQQGLWYGFEEELFTDHEIEITMKDGDIIDVAHQG